MVDGYGRWTPEKDCSTYPKEKWCDMDRAYQIILNEEYEIKTDAERVLGLAIDIFEEDDLFTPKYKNDGSINIEMLHEFINASGGLKEFDYEC